jgi:phosphoglycerate dehydrogenase-like enzyme
MRERETNVAVFLKEDPEPYRDRLQDTSEVRYRFAATVGELGEAIGDADVLLASAVPPARLLADARELRWIQVAAAGVDAFFAAELPQKGVLMTRITQGFGQPIAEYVLGHLLSVAQGIDTLRRQQQQRTWAPFITELLQSQVVGVVGIGSIGTVVAERVVGLGMRAMGLARTARSVPPFERVYGMSERMAFFSAADAVVLCVPLNASTRHLIGTSELEAMKPSALLVNVSRGAVVDEAALIDALRRRAIRGAILDVFEEEPLPVDSPLWDLENVTITPHLAGLNRPEMIVEEFLENLARFRAGQPLHGVVDPQRGY